MFPFLALDLFNLNLFGSTGILKKYSQDNDGNFIRNQKLNWIIDNVFFIENKNYN